MAPEAGEPIFMVVRQTKVSLTFGDVRKIFSELEMGTWIRISAHDSARLRPETCDVHPPAARRLHDRSANRSCPFR